VAGVAACTTSAIWGVSSQVREALYAQTIEGVVKRSSLLDGRVS
jgi:hypothetical protein